MTSTRILLYDRLRRSVEEERVFKPRFMEFFYGNALGRIITDLVLRREFFTRFYGYRKRRPSSRQQIAPFVREYGVDMSESLRPIDSFSSFNDFFIRQLRPTARPIDPAPEVLISPADARLLVHPIRASTVVGIKGRPFTIGELTHSDSIEAEYRGGQCLVFRLAPADYHRFCYVDDCSHRGVRRIVGRYHSIHPLALQTGLPILPKNYREVTILDTQQFGRVVQIDVGALGVGRIEQHHRGGGQFRRGEEKGYFEWGASTTVLLVKLNVRIDEDILRHSDEGIETRVRYGSRIGHLA